MYIWSLAMRKNFARHLEIIIEKIGIVLLSSRLLNQTLCFRNDKFLYEKSKKPTFHKNLDDFFCLFPNMTFENTLLVDYMPHKNMFNPPFSANVIENMHSFFSIDFYLQLVWIIFYNFEKEKTLLATSNFLFQDGVDVAYLSMGNHKTFNTRRIWCYLSNLGYPLGFLEKGFVL
jgi:hypothetical protein